MLLSTGLLGLFRETIGHTMSDVKMSTSKASARTWLTETVSPILMCVKVTQIMQNSRACREREKSCRCLQQSSSFLQSLWLTVKLKHSLALGYSEDKSKVWLMLIKTKVHWQVSCFSFPKTKKNVDSGKVFFFLWFKMRLQLHANTFTLPYSV